MLRKLISIISIALFVLLPMLSFADDIPCPKGDRDPLCNPDMHLYPNSNPNQFCDESSDNKPNTFRHAAVQGANDMGHHIAWPGLEAQLKGKDGVSRACGYEMMWCANEHHDTRANCEKLHTNCMNDDNAFLNLPQCKK